MKFIVLSCLLAVASAAPQYYNAPAQRSNARSEEVIPILRDERTMADDATRYSFNVETGDGIRREEFGNAIEDGSAEGAVAQSGKISFTLPDGQLFELTFVADENGFQPQSSFLPVAPEFPHEIPQFVLDQIEKARREDEEEARASSRSSNSYSPPSPSYRAP